MRHHPRGLPHEFADGGRQACSTGDLCLLAMPGFVVPHGFNDSAAAMVRFRQPIEMATQMALDLPLGLGHEAQAGAIPQQCGEGADAERTRVPQGLERARAAAEFGEMKRSFRKNTLGQSVDTICGHVKAKSAPGEDATDRPFLYLVKDDEAYVVDGAPGSAAATAYRNICP